jgi:DNA-directed RNA polymerase specialized sigma24 family protein
MSEELVRKMKGGDEAAFRVIYDFYWDVIYHFIRMKSGSRIFAEEVAQRIFQEVWMARSEFNDTAGLKHFIALRSRDEALRICKHVSQLVRNADGLILTLGWTQGEKPGSTLNLNGLASENGRNISG